MTVAALVALGAASRGWAPSTWPACAWSPRCSVYEHAIVRPDDLSRLNMAFFNLNGYVSVAFFVATLIDVIL